MPALVFLSLTESIFLLGPGHSAAHLIKRTMPTFSKELCSRFQKNYAQLPTFSKGLCQRFQKDSVPLFKRTLYHKLQISILKQHLNIQCLGVCGWLCQELKILWKCYQPVLMYSLVSTRNKELSLIGSMRGPRQASCVTLPSVYTSDVKGKYTKGNRVSEDYYFCKFWVHKSGCSCLLPYWEHEEMLFLICPEVKLF